MILRNAYFTYNRNDVKLYYTLFCLYELENKIFY